MFSGTCCGTSLTFDKSIVISLFQIGAAPVIPEERLGLIGELSLFPTHTATRYEGVNPIVQLSLLLSLVPVLTETVCPVIFKGELVPNSHDLALLSDKILEII